MIIRRCDIAASVLAAICGAGCFAVTEGQAAPAVLAVDVASGRLSGNVEGETPHHPASLTKMMTAYLAFQAIEQGQASLDDVLSVSDRAAGQGGALLGLVRGERITLGRAIEGMIVRSANDAAVAIAEHLAGSESAFAERMSETAQRLGMTSTRFRNASGITASGHVTTPRDMAVLALALMHDFPGRMGLFARREIERNGQHLPSVNGFLSAFDGARGMKTGFTCPAGYNLVALAVRGTRQAIVVVMGATSGTERLSAARAAMTRALGAEPSGLSLAALGAAAGAAPPDLSVLSCGRRAGPSSSSPLPEARPTPSGWALEVAFGLDPNRVKLDTALYRRALAPQLHGGSDLVVMLPRDGVVRYRGLIVGLDERHAVDTCLAERARRGEDTCTVLTPLMLDGAMEEERRYQRIVAR